MRPDSRRAVASTGRRRNGALGITSVASSQGAAHRRGLPSTVELVLGNQIYIPKEGCIPDFEIGCFGWRRFRIPSSTKRRRCGFRHTASHASSRALRISRIIGLPRGCLDDVRKTLADLGVRAAIRDERRDGSRLE